MKDDTEQQQAGKRGRPRKKPVLLEPEQPKRKRGRQQRVPRGALIAQEGAWSLYEQEKKPGESSSGWRNFNLVRSKQGWRTRVSFWFGFDGLKLSRSTHAGNLRKFHPTVYLWVLHSLVGQEEKVREMRERMREEEREAQQRFAQRKVERDAQRAANPVQGHGVLIAQQGEWYLHERPSFPITNSVHWRNYKLVWKPARKVGYFEKRAYWFGCNGSRFGRGYSGDLGRLSKQQPAVFSWLKKLLLRA